LGGVGALESTGSIEMKRIHTSLTKQNMINSNTRVPKHYGLNRRLVGAWLLMARAFERKSCPSRPLRSNGKRLKLIGKKDDGKRGGGSKQEKKDRQTERKRIRCYVLMTNTE